MGLKTGNVVQTKASSAAYTDVAAKTLFILPPNAMPIAAKTNGTPSNALTTGVLTLYRQPVDGSSAAAAFAVVDVKTPAAGVTGNGILSGISFNRQSKAQIISAIYTETGTAATAGAWTILVDFL